LTCEGSVTDEQDTVVELGTAAGVGVDTRLVELERFLVSLDSNGDRAKLDGSHEGGVSAIIGNILVRGDVAREGRGSAGGRRRILASTISGSVRVLVLSAETASSDDVLEGLVHQTTLTTLVAVGLRAVNKHLLGEGDELASLEGNSAFNGTSGGERPARTALLLVLDGGNSNHLFGVGGGVPVKGGGGSSNVVVRVRSEVQLAVKVTVATVVAKVDGLELGVGLVTELVHGEGERGVLLLVVEVDLVKVLLEDGVTVEEVVVGVLLVVLLHPFGEEQLVFLLLELVRGNEGDEQGNADE